MRIYKSEKDIQDVILANTSIAYTSEIIKPSSEQLELIKSDVSKFSFAKDLTDEDLYFHTAILVTTSWNKNNDVFLPTEVWSARKTPINKPTNFDHQCSKIVGHITNSWPIDEHNNLLDSTLAVDELPSKFHILVAACIYKIWHNDPEYQEQVNELLASIESGKKFVSMECLFNNFDYTLLKDNEVKIVARNADTAFLTKHLSAYGGSGQYEGYKLGRALKNIKFIGKGYVDQPANPESIIFTSKDFFDFAKNLQNYNNLEEISVLSSSKQITNGECLMSDVQKLEQENTTLANKIKELEQELSKSNLKTVQDLKDKAEASLVDTKNQLAESQKTLSELKGTVDSLKADVDNVTKARDEYKAQLDEAKAQKLLADRVSALVDLGLAKEDAENKVKVFANLNDEQFNTLAQELGNAAKMVFDKKKMEEDKAKKDSCKADEDQDESKDADLEDVDTDENAEASAEDTNNDEQDDLANQVANLVRASLKVKLSNGDNK